MLVNGVAKTYAMTGWRVGWMVGPTEVITAAAESAVAHDVEHRQHVAACRDRGPDRTVGADRGDATGVRPKAGRRSSRASTRYTGFRTPTPQGAFYVYPDVTALLGREWGGSTPTSTLQLADLLLDECEVAVVPGEAFGPSGYLRFSYALGDEALAEGVARLAKFFG